MTTSRHIFDTTSDYAGANRFATWLLGGLNLHVIHHMFPRICHVHYPALTKIVKTTPRSTGSPTARPAPSPARS